MVDIRLSVWTSLACGAVAVSLLLCQLIINPLRDNFVISPTAGCPSSSASSVLPPYLPSLLYTVFFVIPSFAPSLLYFFLLVLASFEARRIQYLLLMLDVGGCDD